ncbi:hypothetical protein [Gorillibacterium sp. sgz500922]|uniref:hypothetical protein n=1 Tax=Gorillibacterium sp. sgz500922 TaxID=3446694 RepID=UPI003F66527F
MFMLFGIVCIFVIIFIGINDENRLKNTFLSILVLCTILALMSGQTLQWSDSETVPFLTFFQPTRGSLLRLQYLLYLLMVFSLLGYLYEDGKRR